MWRREISKWLIRQAPEVASLNRWLEAPRAEGERPARLGEDLGTYILKVEQKMHGFETGDLTIADDKNQKTLHIIAEDCFAARVQQLKFQLCTGTHSQASFFVAHVKIQKTIGTLLYVPLQNNTRIIRGVELG